MNKNLLIFFKTSIMIRMMIQNEASQDCGEKETVPCVNTGRLS